jgi:3-methyl-2-oxobutanoate hydroxymethyltransferase
MSAPEFKERKHSGDKITVLTAYDYPSAQAVDAAGVDAILIGDSCANVMMGHENTLSITLDEMIHHVRMVTRGAENALVIADMPFMSYHVSVEESIRNAGRLISEGHAHCIKLEGPPSIFGDTITAIQNASIPVMGHLGLTPQSIHKFGGHKVQGRDPETRKEIIEAAKGLDELGCFGIVLECIPSDLATEITEAISCPTIGIGAGATTDGQVLVMHDILGWGFTRFTKTFIDVKSEMEKAFKGYVSEVKAGTFPAKENEYR